MTTEDRDAADRLECYASPAKSVGLLALTVALVAVSAFGTTLPGWEPKLFGWLGVGFFGLGFVAIPARMRRRGPEVVIDREGIWGRGLGADPIPWSEVRSLRIASVSGTRLLCIDLHDPSRFLAGLSRCGRAVARANAALGFSPACLGFVGLTPGIDEAWRFVEALGVGTTPADDA